MEKIKLGIIGGGFVARFHVRALRQVRDIEVTGITHPGVQKIFPCSPGKMD